MSRWNPTTRAIKYDPEKVAAACRRRAAALRKAGRTKEADGWENEAAEVEAGCNNARDAAFILLLDAEEGLDT